MGKLLFITLLSQGHLNVATSVGKKLLDKYPEHEVYFAVDEQFSKKIVQICHLFKPILLNKIEGAPNEEDFEEEFEESFYKTGLDYYIANFNAIELVQDIEIYLQPSKEKCIKEVKPDFILMDTLFNLPYVQNKNIPWGHIVSCNPLMAQDVDSCPPAMSGLSADAKKDGHLWAIYRENKKKFKIFEKRKKWFQKCNVGLDDKQNEWFLNGSNYLNFYTYPKYAEYFDPKELSGRWFSNSHSILDGEIENRLKRKDENENTLKKVKYPGKELLTPEFLAKPGKLILFSLGTLVSDFTKTMNKFIDAIASLDHKFIISCGKSFSKIKLPENSVGAEFLDQKELYSYVDLVITHGGNNTFNELFHLFKKPFIAISFFGDQPDNATRTKDLNVGTSISLNDVSSETLSKAIELVITNDEMQKRMSEAAKLSNSDNRLEEFIDELHLYLTKQNKQTN